MDRATAEMYRRAAMEAASRKRRRTRLVRVDQKHIDWLLKHERPSPRLREFPESMDRLRPGFRAYHASIAASLKRSADRNADILRQYRARGYAEIELVAEHLDEDGDGEEEDQRDAIAGGAAMPAKKKVVVEIDS